MRPDKLQVKTDTIPAYRPSPKTQWHYKTNPMVCFTRQPSLIQKHSLLREVDHDIKSALSEIMSRHRYLKQQMEPFQKWVKRFLVQYNDILRAKISGNRLKNQRSISYGNLNQSIDLSKQKTNKDHKQERMLTILAQLQKIVTSYASDIHQLYFAIHSKIKDSSLSWKQLVSGRHQLPTKNIQMIREIEKTMSKSQKFPIRHARRIRSQEKDTSNITSDTDISMQLSKKQNLLKESLLQIYNILQNIVSRDSKQAKDKSTSLEKIIEEIKTKTLQMKDQFTKLKNKTNHASNACLIRGSEKSDNKSEAESIYILNNRDYTEKIDKLEAEKIKLIKENTTLSLKMETLKERQRQIETLKAEKGQLKKQRDYFLRKMEEHDNRIKNIEIESHQMKKSLILSQEGTPRSKANIDTLRSSTDLSESEREGRISYRDLPKILKQMENNQINELQKKNEELKNIITVLQTKLHEETQKLTQQKKNTENAQKQVKKWEEDFNQMKKQKQKCSETIETHVNTIGKLQDNNKQLEKTLFERQIEVKGLRIIEKLLMMTIASSKAQNETFKTANNEIMEKLRDSEQMNIKMMKIFQDRQAAEDTFTNQLKSLKKEQKKESQAVQKTEVKK